MTSYKAMSDSQIVIRSCNDKRAESIFHCRRGKGLPVEIQQPALYSTGQAVLARPSITRCGD